MESRELSPKVVKWDWCSARAVAQALTRSAVEALISFFISVVPMRAPLAYSRIDEFKSSRLASSMNSLASYHPC